MTAILFKGKENLAEVQEFLNKNCVENSFRVRKSFVQDGKDYPEVVLLEYKDVDGVLRVLTPGRLIGVVHGIVVQTPQ